MINKPWHFLAAPLRDFRPLQVELFKAAHSTDILIYFRRKVWAYISQFLLWERCLHHAFHWYELVTHLICSVFTSPHLPISISGGSYNHVQYQQRINLNILQCPKTRIGVFVVNLILCNFLGRRELYFITFERRYINWWNSNGFLINCRLYNYVTAKRKTKIWFTLCVLSFCEAELGVRFSFMIWDLNPSSTATFTNNL